MNINNLFDALAKIISDRENAEVKITVKDNVAEGLKLDKKKSIPQIL